MIYARKMAFRIALFVIPALSVIGLVILFNSLNAPPSLFVAAYTLIAGSTGAAIGCFANRSPERPSSRRARFDPDH